MKTLYLIGGPMGVGKTAAGQALKLLLDNSVFLDGDWCWDMHPFRVTEETKELVLGNIALLLNRFLRCSACDHVILAWVLHRQEVLDALLEQVDTAGVWYGPSPWFAGRRCCAPASGRTSPPDGGTPARRSGGWPTCPCTGSCIPNTSTPQS